MKEIVCVEGILVLPVVWTMCTLCVCTMCACVCFGGISVLCVLFVCAFV